MVAILLTSSREALEWPADAVLRFGSACDEYKTKTIELKGSMHQCSILIKVGSTLSQKNVIGSSDRASCLFPENAVFAASWARHTIKECRKRP